MSDGQKAMWSKGGQHCGLPVYGVRVTHIPTGLVAFCDAERSQLHNRNVAEAMLEYGLLELGWDVCKAVNMKQEDETYREFSKRRDGPPRFAPTTVDSLGWCLPEDIVSDDTSNF